MIAHGHVFPRADGTKQDCGGPRHCAMCAAEQNALDTVLANPGAIDVVLESESGRIDGNDLRRRSCIITKCYIGGSGTS